MSKSNFYFKNTLYTRRSESLEPLIEYMLYARKHTCIHADEGVGKSTLGQQLKHCLTSKTPFLNMLDVPKHCNCLWVMGEKTEEDHWDRVDQMKKIVPINDDKWALYNTYDTCFDIKEDTNRFIEEIAVANMKFDVIFLDSLSNFVDGDMNHNTTANHWVRNIRRVADIYGASIMAFSHVKKETFYQKQGGGVQKTDNGKYLFGAKQWGGFFDIIYELKFNKGIHTLLKRKDNRGVCFKDLDMQMICPQDDRLGRLGYVLPIAEESNMCKNEAIIATFLQHHKKYIYPDIYKDMNIPRASFHYSVKKLTDSKKAYTEKDENGKIWYVWKFVSPTV